jgi:hypothetical protein
MPGGCGYGVDIRRRTRTTDLGRHSFALTYTVDGAD